jgi:hypothetical protein
MAKKFCNKKNPRECVYVTVRKRKPAKKRRKPQKSAAAAPKRRIVRRTVVHRESSSGGLEKAIVPAAIGFGVGMLAMKSREDFFKDSQEL